MTSRTRSFVGLACALAVIGIWQLAHRRSALERLAPTNTATRPAKAASPNPALAPDVRLLTNLVPPPALATPPVTALDASTALAPALAAAPVDPRFPRRLRNTPQSINELVRNDSAVLLRNALIDTATEVPLALPPHLKADAEPGSYVVQAKGPITRPSVGSSPTRMRRSSLTYRTTPTWSCVGRDGARPRELQRDPGGGSL